MTLFAILPVRYTVHESLIVAPHPTENKVDFVSTKT